MYTKVLCIHHFLLNETCGVNRNIFHMNFESPKSRLPPPEIVKEKPVDVRDNYDIKIKLYNVLFEHSLGRNSAHIFVLSPFP